ncbi:MAG: carboxypeptidase-like regulatory domain-containing protein [Acidimicrobiia bacterium]|nr:carboxypeptidase-like regulatory domain-containing protein [Acidimicrobiia bacterium]MDH4365920.1 carboxypeptidase-like regulatory domain-containing protein [Acidimicrobiia bacterium]
MQLIPLVALALALALVVAAAGCGRDGAAWAPPSSAAPAGPDASAQPPGPTLAIVTSSSGEPGTSAPPVTTPSTTRPASTPPSTSSTPSTSPVNTATTGGGAAGQRLAGTVTASPTCPVERADQPCAPRPVANAHIEAFDRSEHLVTSIDTDDEGRFALTLAPGRYVLTASSGAVFPSCPPLTVDVPTSGTARADIACDTGIR